MHSTSIDLSWQIVDIQCCSGTTGMQNLLATSAFVHATSPLTGSARGSSLQHPAVNACRLCRCAYWCFCWSQPTHSKMEPTEGQQDQHLQPKCNWFFSIFPTIRSCLMCAESHLVVAVSVIHTLHGLEGAAC